MVDFTPNPVALAPGPLEIRWYGIAYVAAILVRHWWVRRHPEEAAAGSAEASPAPAQTSGPVPVT
jgi:prolipoprotein diacylglyceryltransferase